MINAERQQLLTRITDIYGQLNGIVPQGLMNRVAQLGGEIPNSGPGSYRIPNALERANNPGTPPKSKEERRNWNLNHQRSH